MTSVPRIRPAATEVDLARWVAESPKSGGLTGTDPDEGRSAYARDRARVLHSAAFRKLAGKTQVVAPDEDDVPRTRLTHSLEVAQIGRDIAHRLGADPDLVDLAGLAHDIGHPPFGHNGEQALDRVGDAAGGFEANAQNLRLLTFLELKVLDHRGRSAGLNLTRAALDAVLKYPFPRPAGGGKFGVYPDEAEVFGWIRRPVPGAGDRSVESQIMDWSDDVAYSVHDVEDGILAGRIDPARLADPDERDAVVAAAAQKATGSDSSDLRAVLDDLLEVPVIAAGLRASGEPGAPRLLATKSVTSELIGRFVTGAVNATRAVSEWPLRRYDGELRVPAVLQTEVALLKAVAERYVMASPARRALQVRQQELLVELVTALADRGADALDAWHGQLYALASDDAGRLRIVLDQVSSFTDAQAVGWHRKLVAS